jgi:hypothetical protein
MTFSIPICANPLAPPPLKARPIFSVAIKEHRQKNNESRIIAFFTKLLFK